MTNLVLVLAKLKNIIENQIINYMYIYIYNLQA